MTQESYQAEAYVELEFMPPLGMPDTWGPSWDDQQQGYAAWMEARAAQHVQEVGRVFLRRRVQDTGSQLGNLRDALSRAYVMVSGAATEMVPMTALDLEYLASLLAGAHAQLDSVATDLQRGALYYRDRRTHAEVINFPDRRAA